MQSIKLLRFFSSKIEFQSYHPHRSKHTYKRAINKSKRRLINFSKGQNVHRIDFHFCFGDIPVSPDQYSLSSYICDVITREFLNNSCWNNANQCLLHFYLLLWKTVIIVCKSIYILEGLLAVMQYWD